MRDITQTQPQLASDYSDTVLTLLNLKELYRVVDDALFNVANTRGESAATEDLQEQLLHRKDVLVNMAIKTDCSDIQEISQKVDFLNLVHLDELSASDVGETDSLTKSIWKDCQAFL